MIELTNNDQGSAATSDSTTRITTEKFAPSTTYLRIDGNIIDDTRRAGLTALREPFPASAVSYLPKGGTKLAYVGHANVTDRLLASDLAWNWKPLARNADGTPLIKQEGKLLTLWIELTVNGVTRLGVGTCEPGKFDPLKELVGDAIRNAAMRFGVALDLWSKAELEHGDQNETPPTETKPKRANRPTPPAKAATVPTPDPVPQPPAGNDSGEITTGTVAADADKPSTAQTRKLMALLAEHGLGDDNARRAFAGVDSFTELTKTDTHRLIEQLETGDITAWPASENHSVRKQLLAALAETEPENQKRRQLLGRSLLDAVESRISSDGWADGVKRKPNWAELQVGELQAMLALLAERRAGRAPGKTDLGA